MTRLRSLALAAALSALAATPSRAAFGDITLVGYLAFPTATRITNVWGYYDQATGKDYALVGDWFGGFYIVDCSDPANPVEIRKVTGVAGFDLKPWGPYVYSCDGNSSGTDTRITDISNPLFPVTLPALLPSSHTIAISTRGVMYLEFPGLRIYDLVNDPENPDSLTQVSFVNGHDSTPRGDRLYDFTGDAMNIWDVSNPAAPVFIGGDNDATVGYYHSGDQSKNADYLYVCDEFAVTPIPDIIIYNISDPTTPARIGDINDPTARVHQIYVAGDLMFVGYYTSGFKTFDITNPAAPVLVDEYDTSPFSAESGSDVYNGAYNAYPFTRTGHVYVSDHPTGLYIFAVEGHTGTATGVSDRTPRARATLAQNYPNPFNPSTTIPYEVFERGGVRLTVFGIDGSRVRVLVDSEQPAGLHSAVWDGRDDQGRAAASGVYYYRLETGASAMSRRMVLLK